MICLIYILDIFADTEVWIEKMIPKRLQWMKRNLWLRDMFCVRS